MSRENFTIKVKRYLNLDTNRTYYVLKIYNGYSGERELPISPKKAKELIKWGVECDEHLKNLR